MLLILILRTNFSAIFFHAFAPKKPFSCSCFRTEFRQKLLFFATTLYSKMVKSLFFSDRIDAEYKFWPDGFPGRHGPKVKGSAESSSENQKTSYSPWIEFYISERFHHSTDHTFLKICQEDEEKSVCCRSVWIRAYFTQQEVSSSLSISFGSQLSVLLKKNWNKNEQ